MRSGPAAVTAIAPVVAAGVGVRYGSIWVIRMASFRLDDPVPDDPVPGGPVLGIQAPPAASATLVDLLSGRIAPSYGRLTVLGHDMATARGRALASPQVGVASRTARTFPGIRVRGLAERAARLSAQPDSDRHLLVAAILDRLALTPWAEVPLRAAPEMIMRKARLAAACVHQPKLLLADGMLDELDARDRTLLADIVRDLARDTAVVALGTDADALALLGAPVLTLARGVVTIARPRRAATPVAIA